MVFDGDYIETIVLFGKNFSLGDVSLRSHDEGGLQYNTVKSLKISVLSTSDPDMTPLLRFSLIYLNSVL